MSHKDRSIRGSRCEAQRIYNQRRYINKLEKDKKQLQQRISNTIEYINFLAIGTQGIKEELIDKCVMGMVKFNQTIWGEELLDLLKGDKE